LTVLELVKKSSSVKEAEAEVSTDIFFKIEEEGPSEDQQR
jgi:hypothetical protein